MSSAPKRSHTRDDDDSGGVSQQHRRRRHDEEPVGPAAYIPAIASALSRAGACDFVLLFPSKSPSDKLIHLRWGSKLREDDGAGQWPSQLPADIGSLVAQLIKDDAFPIALRITASSSSAAPDLNIELLDDCDHGSHVDWAAKSPAFLSRLLVSLRESGAVGVVCSPTPTMQVKWSKMGTCFDEKDKSLLPSYLVPLAGWLAEKGVTDVRLVMASEAGSLASLALFCGAPRIKSPSSAEKKTIMAIDAASSKASASTTAELDGASKDEVAATVKKASSVRRLMEAEGSVKASPKKEKPAKDEVGKQSKVTQQGDDEITSESAAPITRQEDHEASIFHHDDSIDFGNDDPPRDDDDAANSSSIGSSGHDAAPTTSSPGSNGPDIAVKSFSPGSGGRDVAAKSSAPSSASPVENKNAAVLTSSAIERKRKGMQPEQEHSVASSTSSRDGGRSRAASWPGSLKKAKKKKEASTDVLPLPWTSSRFSQHSTIKAREGSPSIKRGQAVEVVAGDVTKVTATDTEVRATKLNSSSTSNERVDGDKSDGHVASSSRISMKNQPGTTQTTSAKLQPSSSGSSSRSSKPDSADVSSPPPTRSDGPSSAYNAFSTTKKNNDLAANSSSKKGSKASSSNESGKASTTKAPSPSASEDDSPVFVSKSYIPPTQPTTRAKRSNGYGKKKIVPLDETEAPASYLQKHTTNRKTMKGNGHCAFAALCKHLKMEPIDLRVKLLRRFETHREQVRKILSALSDEDFEKLRMRLLPDDKVPSDLKTLKEFAKGCKEPHWFHEAFFPVIADMEYRPVASFCASRGPRYSWTDLPVFPVKGAKIGTPIGCIHNGTDHYDACDLKKDVPLPPVRVKFWGEEALALRRKALHTELHNKFQFESRAVLGTKGSATCGCHDQIKAVEGKQKKRDREAERKQQKQGRQVEQVKAARSAKTAQKASKTGDEANESECDEDNQSECDEEDGDADGKAGSVWDGNKKKNKPAIEDEGNSDGEEDGGEAEGTVVKEKKQGVDAATSDDESGEDESEEESEEDEDDDASSDYEDVSGRAGRRGGRAGHRGADGLASAGGKGRSGKK